MGFFDTLRRVLHGRDAIPGDVASAWGLTEHEQNAGPRVSLGGDADGAGEYDRANWRKKLKRVLAALPESRSEWTELMAEARALNLGPDWIKQCQADEFQLLIRKVVSDRHVSEAEHHKLDLARDLIGIPEAQAEAALHAIIAEAESFFGKPVEDS